MRKRRRVLPVILLCLCTIAAYSQQNWQGNAAVARSGELTAPGMVAASNAFAENTTILVQNAQTGQSVQVTVIQRIQGTSSVFLLLSEEAGKQIGLTGSQVIRVRANVVSTLGADLSESLMEEAYSPDPDLNPALSVAEEQLRPGAAGPEAEEESVAEQPVEIAQVGEPEPPEEAVEQPAEEVTPAAQIEAEAAEEVTEPVVEEQPVEAEPPVEIAQVGEPEIPEEAVEQPAETPVAAEPTAEQKRLQELTDRIPQKQLYMPPRQQEVYALAPEPEPAAEVAEVQEEPPVEQVAEELPEEVAEVEEQIEVVAEAEPEEPIEVVEEGPPRVSMLGPEVEEEPLEVALPGPQASEPEKPSPEGTRLPAPEEETPLTMAPEEPPTTEIEEVAAAEQVVETPVTEEQPAEQVAAAEEPVVAEEAVAELAMAEAPAEGTIVLSEVLPSRTYFVQLGAYSTRNLAENLAGDLTRRYSVTILPADSGGRRFYKVLVGPLNVDESGTLLYQFRSRGFKDAFIQYVE
jgi:hypothetical protein